MKYQPIKSVAFATGVQDPDKNASFRDQFGAQEGVLSIEEDERGYITLTALRNGQPNPERGIVRVPPSNVRGICHMPAPAEKKK